MCSAAFCFLYIVMSSTKKKKKVDTPIGKEDVKLFLIVDDITIYRKQNAALHTLYRTKKQI